MLVVPSCLYLWRQQLDNCELNLDSWVSDTCGCYFFQIKFLVIHKKEEEYKWLKRGKKLKLTVTNYYMMVKNFAEHNGSFKLVQSQIHHTSVILTVIQCSSAPVKCSLEYYAHTLFEEKKSE